MKESKLTYWLVAIFVGGALGQPGTLRAIRGFLSGPTVTGTWRAVMVEDSGRSLAITAKNPILKLHEDGGISGMAEPARYVLDPQRSAIDFIFEGRTHPCIYRLSKDGRTLTICLSESHRPTQFETSPKNGNSLMIMQRVD